MVISIFLLLRLNPDVFSDELFSLINPKETLKIKTKRIQKGKKKNAAVRALLEIKHMLIYTHQSKAFSLVIISSFILAIIGVSVACLGNNPYLIIPLAFGMCTVPFIIVQLYTYSYVKKLRDELEVTTSIITTSYLRNNDIVSAVRENLNYIRRPLKQIFQEFVTENELINPDTRQAIDNMENKIDDDIFKEWCEALKKCSSNSTLKYMLNPIVDKYSKLRKINLEIEPEINGNKVQMLGVIGIVYINFPLLRLMSNDSNNWYSILVNTTQGKITIAAVVSITVVTLLNFVKLIRPTKYRI